MPNKLLKRCSTSLTIKKIKVKTAMRSHNTSITTAKIKNSNNTKRWQGCGETTSLMYFKKECKPVPDEH